MVTYHMTIAGVERDLPICPLNDELSIAGFVMFGDVELTVACAKALLERTPEYDYLLTAEAKGIPLAYEMARQSGQNKYFLARKKAKAYMQGVVVAEVHSITTAGMQQLFLDSVDAEEMKGKRILIVDDVISTGESLHALEVLVQQVGGIIAGRMSVLAEGDAQSRDDIIYLEKLPLFHADGTPIQ